MTDDPPDSEDARVPPQDLDSLVADEVLRARVRRLIDERPREPAWQRFARHPLVTLVLGFALTWGVGTLLTKRWEQAQLQSQIALEQVRRSTEARIAIINDIFGIFAEHSARAFLVDSALARNAPTSELADLVRAKRELFAKSSAQFGIIQFRLRGLLPPVLYDQFLEAFDMGLYVPLQIIDRVQAIAFEDRLERRRTPHFTQNQREKLDEALKQVTECRQALSEALWFGAIAETDAAPPSQRESSLKRMENACKLR